MVASRNTALRKGKTKMNEAKYAVKINGGKPDINIVEKQEGEDMLRFCYKQIECDLIDIAPIKGLSEQYIMVCDDEGLLKDQPCLNIVGSYLYGTQNHGNPIVGNVLIMKEGNADIQWLTKDEANEVMFQVASVFVPALEAIMKNAR